MKQLYIENFKGIESENISFKKLTVLAGENGAGKSTVIQVLSIIKQSYDIHKLPIENIKSFYLNDYYCELGTFRDILYCEAKQDLMLFGFRNEGEEVFFECVEDKENTMQLKINHISLKGIPLTRGKKNFVDRFMSDFDFISADRFGPKTFYHVDGNFSTKKVGKYGEYTGVLLGKLKSDHVFFHNLNKVLQNIFGYVEILADHLDGVNISLLQITNSTTKSLGYKNPVNMPYGVSYVLPIIVSCLLRDPSRYKKHEKKEFESIIENPVVVVENPEAHLHPAAQSKLGVFLAQMAANGVQIILETHSDHIINGIRKAIKNKIISHQDVIFNFFEKSENVGENNIFEIYPFENGVLSNWPKGFFDQYENDLLELI
ncbi:DUF3696 domain-containing protein [Sulfurospirillum sp. UCH001]|uniref:AAA family ATPase n=1 Tax=Sulfurospirillum sp. UCH001 TaxID=1581011 RepID=UPI0008339B53|nr:DUF3696 domain-containing protein [Sulfurospirillum sp. UCH001]